LREEKSKEVESCSGKKIIPGMVMLFSAEKSEKYIDIYFSFRYTHYAFIGVKIVLSTGEIKKIFEINY
jgi:hypothetical protein